VPALFHPSRLTTVRCRDELIAGGLSSADADGLLYEIVKDGRRWPEENRNGPRLYFGDGSLNFLNNPLSAYIVEGDWGLAWLRETPDLNIEASTIRAPKRSGTPPPASTLSEITRETMRQLGGLTGRDPVVRSAPEWAVTPLRIDADDFFRILKSFREAVPTEPPERPLAAHSSVDAASTNRATPDVAEESLQSGQGNKEATASERAVRRATKNAIADLKAEGVRPTQPRVLDRVRKALHPKKCPAGRSTKSSKASVRHCQRGGPASRQNK